MLIGNAVIPQIEISQQEVVVQQRQKIDQQLVGHVLAAQIKLGQFVLPQLGHQLASIRLVPIMLLFQHPLLVIVLLLLRLVLLFVLRHIVLLFPLFADGRWSLLLVLNVLKLRASLEHHF